MASYPFLIILAALLLITITGIGLYYLFTPIIRYKEPDPYQAPTPPDDSLGDYSRCDSAENKTKVCQKIGHKGRSIDGYLSKQYFHVMSPPYHEKVIAMRQLTLVHINDKRYPLPGMVLLRVYKDWALYEIRFAIKLETFMELYYRIFKHCKECISLERTLKNNQK